MGRPSVLLDGQQGVRFLRWVQGARRPSILGKLKVPAECSVDLKLQAMTSLPSSAGHRIEERYFRRVVDESSGATVCHVAEEARAYEALEVLIGSVSGNSGALDRSQDLGLFQPRARSRKFNQDGLKVGEPDTTLYHERLGCELRVLALSCLDVAILNHAPVGIDGGRDRRLSDPDQVTRTGAYTTKDVLIGREATNGRWEVSLPKLSRRSCGIELLRDVPVLHNTPEEFRRILT